MILVGTPELDSESRAVAAGWGFELVGTHRESVLDLDEMDIGAATRAIERATSNGFRLEAMPEDADDAMWHRVYELTLSTWKDAPDAEGATDDMPYSIFRGFFPRPYYVFLAYKTGEPDDVAVGCMSLSSASPCSRTPLSSRRSPAAG